MNLQAIFFFIVYSNSFRLCYQLRCSGGNEPVPSVVIEPGTEYLPSALTKHRAESQGNLAAANQEVGNGASWQMDRFNNRKSGAESLLDNGSAWQGDDSTSSIVPCAPSLGPGMVLVAPKFKEKTEHVAN